MVVYVGIYSTWVCTTGTKPGGFKRNLSFQSQNIWDNPMLVEFGWKFGINQDCWPNPLCNGQRTVQPALGAVSVEEGATRKKRFSLSSLALRRSRQRGRRSRQRAHHVLVVVPPVADIGPRDAKPLAVGALPPSSLLLRPHTGLPDKDFDRGRHHFSY